MRRVTALLLALFVAPVALAAQDGDEPGRFHGGQWALQFGGGSDLFSLGVLRFTSARSAWLIDLSSAVTVLNAESTDKFGGGTTSADQQFVNFQLRLGRRMYQAPRRSVVSFQTIAVETGLSDQMVDVAAGNVRRIIWNAGLNGEIGGAYLLTPSVSIGGTAGVSAGYLSLMQDDPAARDEGTGFYFSGLNVVFTLGVYF